MTIYKQKGNENSDSSSSSKFLDCDYDRRDLKLQEAEKTIANKDVIICMLQSQVKKLEESYKQNVKQAEDFRYRYCIAIERIKQMQCGSDKNEEKRQKNSKKDVCEECPLPEEVVKCNTAFIKSHYVALQALVDEILEKKQQYSNNAGNQSGETNTKIQLEMKNNLSDLQREIDKLKNENSILKEQIEKVKRQPQKDCTECIRISNTSLKQRVSELEEKFAKTDSSESKDSNSKKSSIDMKEILLTDGDNETKDLNSLNDEVNSQEDNNSFKEKIQEIRSRGSSLNAVDSKECIKKRLSIKDEKNLLAENDDLHKEKMKGIITSSLNKENPKCGSVSFHDLPDVVAELDSIAENEEIQMTNELSTTEPVVTVDENEEPIELTPRSRCCFEEVTDKISLLAEKQEFAYKELEQVKKEIGNTRACTENNKDEILKMKELVRSELQELRSKIELLLDNADKGKQDKEDDKITEPEIMPNNIGILEEKYSEMKKQAIEKDQQIQCLNKLVTYYNSLNEEVLCFCPTDSPEPAKNCECGDKLPEKPVIPKETPKPETPKDKPIKTENVPCKQTEKCKCPSGKKCRKEEPQAGKSTDDKKNVLDVNSATHIRIIKPCKGADINKKLSIEDIYQAVRCSRRYKKKTARPDCDCTSSISSTSVGNCLPNCDGCVCVGSLETYVNYLHEQLQVISTIENQIENLRDDIKFPH